MSLIDTNVTILVQDQSTDFTVISQAEQGPPGPAGAQGASDSGLIGISAYPLSGHRLVYLGADQLFRYVTNDDLTHAFHQPSMTTGAVLSGVSMSVVTFGSVEEPSWSWTVGAPVYLGVNGVLTQTPPVAPAFQRVIGDPISPTILFIDVRPPIFLS